MSTNSLSEPVVYVVEHGTPNQFAMLLRSVAALVTHEPPETFGNDAVRSAAGHLSDLLADRAGQSDGTAGTSGDRA
jgi:hypothetical protein